MINKTKPALEASPSNTHCLSLCLCTCLSVPVCVSGRFYCLQHYETRLTVRTRATVSDEASSQQTSTVRKHFVSVFKHTIYQVLQYIYFILFLYLLLHFRGQYSLFFYCTTCTLYSLLPYIYSLLPYMYSLLFVALYLLFTLCCTACTHYCTALYSLNANVTG